MTGGAEPSNICMRPLPPAMYFHVLHCSITSLSPYMQAGAVIRSPMQLQRKHGGTSHSAPQHAARELRSREAGTKSHYMTVPAPPADALPMHSIYKTWKMAPEASALDGATPSPYAWVPRTTLSACMRRCTSPACRASGMNLAGPVGNAARVSLEAGPPNSTAADAAAHHQGHSLIVYMQHEACQVRFVAWRMVK